MQTSLSRFFMFVTLFFFFAGTLASFPADASEAVVRPKQLCIFYGWPSSVNGSGGDVGRAIAEFSTCDMTVLGDGVEHQAHGDHGATVSIIAALRQAGKEVFGYIDLGVSTQNLPITIMRGFVNEWQSMGASGIFLDDAGYDYKVTRVRQNSMVDCIHGAGMKVFINAWQIDDVLADTDESGHGNPSHLAAGDVYLAESWLIAGGAYLSLQSWAHKADKARDFALRKGIRIAGVTTAEHNKAVANDLNTNKFGMGFYGAAMYDLAAWQWTDASYGSGNNTLMLYNTFPWDYGSTFLDAAALHLKNFSRHERRTNSGRIVITGNGNSSGTGIFIKD